jgi:hypothetical protein
VVVVKVASTFRWGPSVMLCSPPDTSTAEQLPLL